MTTKNAHSHPDFPALKRGLQRYQSKRLNRTYADLKADPQYAAIGDFFFNRLYAPEDFTFRDTSIKTLQHALKGKVYRPMTSAMIKVVELHELSDSLDDQMVEKMIEYDFGPKLTRTQYQTIYRGMDNDDQRVHQINLTIDTTRAFYRLSQKWVVAISLKTVNVASHFLNIGEIMSFINEGYTAFRKIHRIDHFIDTVFEREMAWHNKLWQKTKKREGRIP